jgi:hypothetical protein
VSMKFHFSTPLCCMQCKKSVLLCRFDLGVRGQKSARVFDGVQEYSLDDRWSGTSTNILNVPVVH